MVCMKPLAFANSITIFFNYEIALLDLKGRSEHLRVLSFFSNAHQIITYGPP